MSAQVDKWMEAFCSELPGQNPSGQSYTWSLRDIVQATMITVNGVPPDASKEHAERLLRAVVRKVLGE